MSPLNKKTATELRKRITDHGKTTASPTGPVYVPCKCERCLRSRAALARCKGEGA